MYIAVNALAREGYTVTAATQKLGVTRDDYYNAKRKIAPSADTDRGGDGAATEKCKPTEGETTFGATPSATATDTEKQ